jgi:hypothetical protein
MNAKQIIMRLFAAVLLSASLLSGPSLAAPNDSGFSALEGVSAQPLSVEEMQAIAGELNAFDIAAALLAQAANITDARVKAAAIALANYTLANADAINAAFARVHILTACNPANPGCH